MPGGTLVSVNISGGGVSKWPTGSAWIRTAGVEGDRQRLLQIHGGPDRAVSLYSYELIQALQAEGHSIVPGSIGENLTLAGIDWALMRPGALVEVGPVLLELTAYANPCKQISASFANAEFLRVSQKLHPGWSRLYARVLEEGMVKPSLACNVRP
jgi:MOSC domain-containing protein YiiM